MRTAYLGIHLVVEDDAWVCPLELRQSRHHHFGQVVLDQDRQCLLRLRAFIR